MGFGGSLVGSRLGRTAAIAPLDKIRRMPNHCIRVWWNTQWRSSCGMFVFYIDSPVDQTEAVLYSSCFGRIFFPRSSSSGWPSPECFCEDAPNMTCPRAYNTVYNHVGQMPVLGFAFVLDESQFPQGLAKAYTCRRNGALRASALHPSAIRLKPAASRT